MRDSAGNLNGAHPSSHGDPSLHAWVAAASRQRLDKAVALLLEVLQPSNTELRPVTVAPGGSAVLEPLIPADWPEAAAGGAEAAAPAAGAPAEEAAKPPPPPPPANAWASNRLLKQLPRQMSPVSSLQRSQGPTGSSNASSEVDEVEAAQQAAARTVARPAAAAAAAAGALARPPPPPPPRSNPQSPKQPASGPEQAAHQPAVPLTPEQAQALRPPSHGPSPEQAPATAAQQQHPAAAEQEQQAQGQAGQQQMAVVFAKGLHSAESDSASLVSVFFAACCSALPALKGRCLHLLMCTAALPMLTSAGASPSFLPCSPSRRQPLRSAPQWWPSSASAPPTAA